MHIDKISVRNFRNLADIDLDLTPGSVIVGANRSGKSNLLHALRLVLDSSMPNTERSLSREDFWDGLSDGSVDWDPMIAGEVIEISVDITDFQSEPIVVAALGDALLTGNPMRARLTYRWAPTDTATMAGATRKPYKWRIFGGGDEARYIGVELREYIWLSFLHALRDVEADIRAWRRSPLRGLLEAAASAAAANSDLEQVRAAMDSANKQINDLESIAELGKRIGDKTITMVGNDQALETQLGVAPKDPISIIRTMHLYVDGDARRRLALASLGTLNVLYLALLELGLEERLKTRDLAHLVLAVEEPEAHLHPHLQRIIFRRLLADQGRSRTTVVTTQSPFIASVAPPKSLVALRTIDNRTVAAAASSANLEEVDWQDIGRYLDATRAEMVFAKRVLLVEGYGEQVLLPALAKAAGVELDKSGISVCAIHGTHFLVYSRFCDALKIPWSVITDGDVDKDGQSRGQKRAELLIEDLGRIGADAAVFVGDTTLEYDVFKTSAANRSAVVKVFEELLPPNSPKRRDLDTWKTTSPSYETFMLAVESAGGKGRFNQRLALHKLDSPQYIRDSIDFIINQ